MTEGAELSELVARGSLQGRFRPFSQGLRLDDDADVGGLLARASERGMPASLDELRATTDAQAGLSASGGSVELSPTTLVSSGGLRLELTGGHFTFDPELDLDVDLGWWSIDRFEVMASGSMDAELGLRLASDGDYEIVDRNMQLWESPRYAWYGFIGPVPVVVVSRMQLGATVSVRTHGPSSVTLGAGAGSSVKLGAIYEDGWELVGEHEFTFRHRGPEFVLDTELDARVALDGTLKVELYGVVGPQLKISPWARLDADARGKWSADVGVDGRMGGALSLPWHDDISLDAIMAEVPAYTDAWQGSMGHTIAAAVRQALDGFVTIASRSSDEVVPRSAAVDGAYALGRGEARSGRSMDALLAAYRVGAKVAWHELSQIAVAAGLQAAGLAQFAELVFAYIDELSASSVAGHADELATSGRVRQRYLDHLVRQLLSGASTEVLRASAERADWTPPTTLTAVMLPSSQARGAMVLLSERTLQSDAVVPERAELVVRYGGGANAGHTLVIDGQKLVTHLVPSGVCHPGKSCVLGDGMVIDPHTLLDEVAQCQARGLLTRGELLVGLTITSAVAASLVSAWLTRSAADWSSVNPRICAMAVIEVCAAPNVFDVGGFGPRSVGRVSENILGQKLLAAIVFEISQIDATLG